MTPSVTHRPPYNVRVATLSARHRWPVIAVWFLATLIRSVLLPASMRLLGDWNWWMPRVTIEGESDESEVAESDEVGYYPEPVGP